MISKQVFKKICESLGVKVSRVRVYKLDSDKHPLTVETLSAKHPTDRSKCVDYQLHRQDCLVIKDNRPCFYYDIDQGWKLLQYLKEDGYVTSRV